MKLTARRQRVLELLIAGHDIYKAVDAVYKCNSERSLQAQVNQIQNDVDFIREYQKRTQSEPTINEIKEHLWAIVNVPKASITERLMSLRLLYDILSTKRAERNQWRREHDRLTKVIAELGTLTPEPPKPA